uniref:Hypoxia-inducible factor 1-alpha n=1 Tax=Electrophorus electricus TaxID=8005 RepID=A0A4W4DX00_ELEEL
SDAKQTITNGEAFLRHLFVCRMCAEWRKVRSRMAARRRREKESQLFRELATLLSVPPPMEVQLDKAFVIRLTIAHLCLRAVLDSPGSAELNEKWYLDYALGGFLLIVALNGKIIFTTKNVISHTGINQMDLIGQSLFDFMHPCDQNEIKAILMRLIGSQSEQTCDVFIRIKTTGNHRLMPWKVIHCTGVKKSSSIPGFNCLILLCRSLPVQEVIEMEANLNSRTFLSVHGPDMKFTYCHSGVLEMTGFRNTELYGQSVYQYYHPSDCQLVLKAHLILLSKGQVYTGRYRLLQKGGGYVWAETDAAVVYNIRTGKPESVICINYILSAVELPDVVFSLEQTDHLLKPCDSVKPMGQSIPAPFIRALQNRIHALPVLRRYVKMAVSLQDICELDLDSLAPYSPMDEEDFLLTPRLDRAVVHSELKSHLKLDSGLHSPVEKVFLPTTGISSTLQHTDSYFSPTNWYVF